MRNFTLVRSTSDNLPGGGRVGFIGGCSMAAAAASRSASDILLREDPSLCGLMATGNGNGNGGWLALVDMKG